MKPLYLLSRQRTIVALDGPSLVVWGSRRVIQRIPLRQISRIVATGNALLQTSAVCACLDRGIVVTYAGDGGVGGWVTPFGNVESGMADRLEKFCDGPNALRLYADWRAARERAEILGVLRALEVRTGDLRAAAVQAMLGRQLREGEGANFLRLARAVLESRLAAFFTAEGCGTRFAGVAGCLHLIEDFATLLVWARFGEWILEVRGVAREPGDRAVISWLEQRGEEDEDRIGRLAGNFRIWLGRTP